MKSDSGNTESIWMPTVDFPSYPSLAEDKKADVCIIGAGVVGISCAYFLAGEGKSVVLVDDGSMAGGESCRTTAHLSNVPDYRFSKLEQIHGEENFKLAIQSYVTAINQIEAIIKKEKIDCDFERVPGYLFSSPGAGFKELGKELEFALKSGLKDTTAVPKVPLSSFNTGRALRFENQAQFNLLKYMNGLLPKLKQMGVQIFMNTRVKKIEGGSPTKISVKNNFTITANSVIVATHTPFNDWVVMHTKQASYRTYVIGARVPYGSVEKALYWDTEEPYHYVRLVDDVLIVGGEDHKTGQANDAAERYRQLESWMRERFPMAQEIDSRWSGQIIQSDDGLAFIGRNPMDNKNVYIVTGDTGMGITHGTTAARLLTDLILGRANPLEKVFDPSRMRLGSTKEFVRQNLNAVAQYGDWLKASKENLLNAIPPGSGAVLQKGLNKIAAYRDPKGTLHEYSATCPHLGGVVHWNSNEKTWDCPCHGSRFDCHGKVINGPSAMSLSPVEKSPKKIPPIQTKKPAREIPQS